jgi:hypothetical protein
MTTRLNMNQPAVYRIQVQGCLPEHWRDYFGQLNAAADVQDGETVTTLWGAVADQAALHGLLQALYAVGLPILLVQVQNQEDGRDDDV